MSSDSPNLFSLARSKLHLSVGSKDSSSLHRWVLLKNSIIHSPSTSSGDSPTELSEINSTYPPDYIEDDNDTDEVVNSVEVDSFMFPDAGKLVDTHTADVNASEAQWLDSLLETLADDDDDDFNVDSDVHICSLNCEEDEEQFSPLASPMSSSDDLPNQPSYYLPPTIVPYPYPVPYPPFNPSLSQSFEFNSNSSISSLPAPYADPDPLPYFFDDVEDMPVPDAIEDTSDDESDPPLTPSFGRSDTSLPLLDAALVPLPPDRSGLRHAVSHAIPHVYVDTDNSYFYPFELDPLPFPDTHHLPSYHPYQDC